ncbi:hypothetical protein EVAR_77468_1 [Eumeta japonica]|uniref:Uncharacterized protein n=1 Tax=Eumeta variegata TaxID=151549 RepID=A0A4C1T679_EUMVA|nr:hypothetical protein EVAR_77468_1 [Eumeta japonica]
MEANEFITKLKADGSETDVCDFEGVMKEYENINRKLSDDDKKSFGLNVLCLLCRNLDRVPKWNQKVDNKSLLAFSAKCLRDARSSQCAQRVKTLACIFHLHKHMTKQKIPPEEVLNLSYLSFEDACEMPKQYCKTYWAILADSERDNTELNANFEIIFKSLLDKNDYKQKNISETTSIDLYKKLMDCFGVIFEDALRNGSQNIAFTTAVKFALSVLKDSKEICHCIKTFYLNSFSNILDDKESKFVAENLKRVHDDCEMTERLKYEGAMNLTYSYLSHILRIYMDFICAIGKISSLESEKLQTTTLLDMCRMCHRGEYGDLSSYFSTLEFSELLKHEFTQYIKMWPSVMPIAGVWNSLMDLLYRVDQEWITGEQEEHLLWTVCEVIMQTVCVVRSVHNAGYSTVIHRLVEGFGAKIPKPFKFKMAYVVLLFLESEYNIEEASSNHGWKNHSENKDPDTMSLTRALPQEHEAIRRAVQAVELMTEMLPQIKEVKLQGEWLQHALQIMQVSCMQLLHFDKVACGLQLCHILCVISKSTNNISYYQNSLGLILYHAASEIKEISYYLEDIKFFLENVEKNKESTLIFICRFALYLLRCKNVASAAKLVHYVQLHVLKMKCGESMDLVTGHLLEVQSEFFKQDPGRYLSQISTTYKHYLSLKNTGRYLQLWRRARSAAPAALARGAAALLARVHAALIITHHADNAQVKIDNQLKHILGLQPSNEQQDSIVRTNSVENMAKDDRHNIRTELELVMDATFFKKTPRSPSSPCANVRPLKMPAFLSHKNCLCYACANPVCNLVFLQACGLEASMHFRSKEFAIARNYFDDTLKMFSIIEERLLNIVQMYKNKGLEDFVVEILKARILKEMQHIQIEIMVEAAFFELSQRNYNRVDEIVFDVKEKISDADNFNLYNEYLNLLATSAHLRREVKPKMTVEEMALEKEMASLKLSPKPSIIESSAVTPENKITKLPEVKTVLKDYKEEDIPILKKRLKRLNLEETSPEKKTDTMKTRSFKIPVPKVTKAIPETITPQITRCKPTVTISEVPKTPKLKQDLVSNDFSTPSLRQEESIYETPSSELFFTPMTSVKTYNNKKTLKNQIVKNLEMDFRTPKSEVKSDKNSIKPKGKRTLKRATSPGKLEKEKKEQKSMVNTRRLRTQVNFSPEVEVRKTRITEAYPRVLISRHVPAPTARQVSPLMRLRNLTAREQCPLHKTCTNII